MVYAIDNVLELKLSQENAGVEDRFSSGVGGAAGWLLNELAVKELLELPWFGEGTGKIASRVSTRVILCTHNLLCMLIQISLVRV